LAPQFHARAFVAGHGGNHGHGSLYEKAGPDLPFDVLTE
jgi:hypothetical protein